MDVICSDGKFNEQALTVYKKYGVVTPEQESFYNIREVFTHSNGKVGITLEEIKNPQIPFPHHILGQSWMEPTWDIKRFRHLNGDSITREELQQYKITALKD